MPEPSPSKVDLLLEECILALETMDQAAVEAILAAHPDAAPQLRLRLDHLSALGILQAPKPSAAIPEQLGEFRLLRQIGRGGMGIVYLAEQTALQRHVALKLVHPEQLFFGGARERFRREILAVARLQHPGIVPILTSGETEGIPFYAMDLVQGASLAEVLAELAGTAPTALDGPTLRHGLQRAMAKKRELAGVQDAAVFQGSWANVCCRLALAAADALQHAHEQGVLHRDIKPSNLLLTATGQLRIIDFGLASARGAQKLTRSGATFGSLPYMAPEQVRGDVARIDARSDVYALGVVLYELLTLTLPHGDGSGDTREHILAGHVEPPSRRNALVHPDAEAICLLAMDLDPARRYQSAAAFAQDLRAFLEHRTVQARRPSLMLRTRRWARRNPARAATAVVVFFLLVPTPMVFAWQQNAAATRLQTALDDVKAQRTLAENNLRLAEAQQQRAEDNLDQALRAVDLMLLRTAEARLADIPRTASLRRQLLQDAVAFHENLIATAAATAGDQRLREEHARSQARLGSLQADLGDLDKAHDMLREAVDALEILLPTSLRPDTQRLELAKAHEQLAIVFARTDRIEAQEIAQRRAIELYDGGAGAAANPRAVEGAMRTRLGLAISLGRRQRAKEAHALLDELEKRLAPTAIDPPTTSPMQNRVLLWASVADNRGILVAREGDTQQAQRCWLEAMRRLDTLPVAAAAESAVVTLRAAILEKLGLIAHQRREWDQATPFLDRACKEYEALTQAEPEIVGWRVHLARILSTRAANDIKLGNTDGATANHDRAIELLTKGLEISPAESEFRRGLAIALAERASWHARQGDHAAAILDFERSERGFELALTSHAEDDLTKSNLAAAFANHAQSLLATDDLQAARAMTARGIDILRSCPGSESQRSLIELLSGASDLAMRDGDETAAMESMDEASNRAAAHLAAAPDDAASQQTAAMIALNHGTACLNLRQHSKAIAVWQAALPTMRQVAQRSPFGRQCLALTLLRVADVFAREGQIDQAHRSFQAAIAETGVTTTQLEGYTSLIELFERPDFAALLPVGHRDR